MDKEYDTHVCIAVKNDHYGLVDILNKEAENACTGLRSLLVEAACVIANLLEKNGGKIE